MDQDFPFFIHQWFHRPSDKSLHALHHRDFWKIVYVISGSADLNINGKNYDIGPGSILFIHPNDMTNYRINSEQMRIYNLCFLPSLIADRLQHLDNLHDFFSILSRDFIIAPELSRIFYIQDSRKSMYTFFRTILTEYRANHPNREEMLRTLLIELLIRLHRLGLKNFLGNKHANVILKIRDYINRNFNQNIDHRELAEYVGLSQSRLCTIFKQNTGHRISDEILERRLSEADRLLRESSIPISELCFQSGFNDVSHFYREFHKRFGTTPKFVRVNSEQTSSPGVHP